MQSSRAVNLTHQGQPNQTQACSLTPPGAARTPQLRYILTRFLILSVGAAAAATCRCCSCFFLIWLLSHMASFSYGLGLGRAARAVDSRWRLNLCRLQRLDAQFKIVAEDEDGGSGMVAQSNAAGSKKRKRKRKRKEDSEDEYESLSKRDQRLVEAAATGDRRLQFPNVLSSNRSQFLRPAAVEQLRSSKKWRSRYWMKCVGPTLEELPPRRCVCR